jgi:hypothetical protein
MIKKLIFLFFLINSSIFSFDCKGSFAEDVEYSKKYELILKKIQVAIAYNDPQKILSYRNDLLEYQEILYHMLNEHLDDLDSNSLSMLLTIKQSVNEMLKNMEIIESVIK